MAIIDETGLETRADPILTEAELADFKVNGFLAGLRVVPAEQSLAARRELEAYEAETGPAEKTLHIKTHLFFSWAWDLARSPALIGALSQLMGPDILVLASRFWIKEPGDGKFVSWHQDDIYFGLEPRELHSVWIALTPATLENGAMMFVPGSHKQGILDHDAAPSPDNLLSRGQTVRGIDEEQAVSGVLQPGECSIHHGQTLHYSPPNLSDDRRIGFGMMVMPTRCRSTLERRSATLLAGEDRYGYWDLDPMPTCDRDPVILALMAEENTRYRSDRKPA